MHALINQILPQLQSQIASPLFNQARVVEWLEEGYGLQSSVTLKTAKLFEDVLEKLTIEIKGITFQGCSEGDALPIYQNILRKIKRLCFKNCVFDCSRLLLPGVTQWFENCTFSDGWLVSCSRCSHGHTEPGDSLFENCTFNSSVAIIDKEVDGDSLGQYSSLFWNCHADALDIHNINLTTRLWCTDDIPFTSQIRLHELAILNAKVSWPVELSHQEIPKIQIHDCELAGMRFHGGKAETLVIDNCVCDGSCSYEHSKIGVLLINDSTFERHVNLSWMMAGDLIIQRVDFEKVLACNEATIDTQITLRSIRHAVAPDFVDIELSDGAKTNSDRETFRLIKHSFEAVANRIEASRFFGLEMQAYRQELRTRAPRYSRERLLVAFNHAVSRHGQNYTRPFVALLATALINAWLIVHSGLQLPVGLLNESLHTAILAVGDSLNSFAKGFTLFSPVMHPGMEFASLLLTVMMSTFLWHFLVAIRRFRRG